MTAIEVTNIKNFMNALLLTNTFDIFQVEEVNVTTSNSFFIDGRINKAYYSDKDEIPAGDFSSWEEIRPIVTSLIKGKQVPTTLKIVLHLSPEYIEGVIKGKDTTITPDQIKALVTNIKYENGRLLIVTGTSFNTFLMDKSIDNIWDEAMNRFLLKRDLI